MKNLKVIFGFAPVVILAFFINFASATFSPESPDGGKNSTAEEYYGIVDGKITKLDYKPSTACGFKIHPSLDAGCNCTNLTYCVNGGQAYTVPVSQFLIYLEEGYSYTICVQCGSCSGTASFSSGPAPCGVTDIYVDLKNTGLSCSCTQS